MLCKRLFAGMSADGTDERGILLACSSCLLLRILLLYPIMIFLLLLSATFSVKCFHPLFIVVYLLSFTVICLLSSIMISFQ